jgi:uncharacterized protein (TIGR02118 family)
MIKVSVMYANRVGATFDMDYYCNHHVTLVRQLLGDRVKGVEVDEGVGTSQNPAPYIVIGHLWFDSLQAFQAGLGENRAAIMADIPKYTNIEPVIQVSEVKISNQLAAAASSR